MKLDDDGSDSNPDYSDNNDSDAPYIPMHDGNNYHAW